MTPYQNLGISVLIACLVLAVVAILRHKVWLCLTASAVALALRFLLVNRGYVFQTTQVRLLDVALAATLLAVLAISTYSILDTDTKAEQRTALVAGMLALPVAAYALLQLAVPAAPTQLGGVACDGASTAGSSFLAKTGPFGLNARSGPGTTYAPEGRFDAACAIGADGYCVGEAVQDLSVLLPDVRWLRLRHTQQYAAAGTLFSLSPEADLGGAPEDDCPLGLDDPALAELATVKAEAAEMLLVAARPVRTTLVGFGLYYERPKPAAELIEQLGITPKLPDTTGEVRGRLDLRAVRQAAQGAAHVTLAVVPCLAPVVPSHSGEQLFRIDLATGQAKALDASTRQDQIARLRQAACRIDPSMNRDQILNAAKTTP